MSERIPEHPDVTRVLYEGVEDAPPPRRQVWCPVCKATIIDPMVERMCVECEETKDA